jgi:ribose transport system substrate-binding protein
MKKILVFLAAVSILFAACKKQEEAAPPSTAPAPGPGAPAPAAAKLRFAVIPKALSIPVFNYAKTGAEREAKLLGNVEIIWDAPDIADPLKQKEKLEALIAQKVDGIAISCTNSDLLTPTINKAVDSGIPVVTWDSDAPKSKRIAFYGVNDVKSGEIMGENLAKLLNGKGNIAVITALGADNLEKRLNGVRNALKNYPGIKILEVYDCKDDVLVAKQIIETGTKKYADLNGWISVGGWPVFNENGLDPVDTSKVKVVVFDTIPPAPAVMKKGKVNLLVGQKYFGWGSVPVKILYDIVVNKKNPESPTIDSGVDVVTPENVDAYIQKWKKLESGEITE